TAGLWSISSTIECKQEFLGHDHVIECIAFAPSTSTPFIQELSAKELNQKDLLGPFFATGSRDKEIRLWNGISGQCIYIFKGHDNWVRQLLFHPGGKYLISVSDDKTVRCWDLSVGRCAHTLVAHQQFVTCLAMSNTPFYLATGGVDNEIRIWSCK
ncbi:Positively regulates the activity of the minus-end directed microtubule motor protein dynein, partial [Coelomomyces lativittatus]